MRKWDPEGKEANVAHKWASYSCGRGAPFRWRSDVLSRARLQVVPCTRKAAEMVAPTLSIFRGELLLEATWVAGCMFLGSLRESLSGRLASCHMDLSRGLCEHPHDMEAGFPQSKWSKEKNRVSRRPQCLFVTLSWNSHNITSLFYLPETSQ